MLRAMAPEATASAEQTLRYGRSSPTAAAHSSGGEVAPGDASFRGDLGHACTVIRWTRTGRVGHHAFVRRLQRRCPMKLLITLTAAVASTRLRGGEATCA